MKKSNTILNISTNLYGYSQLNAAGVYESITSWIDDIKTSYDQLDTTGINTDFSEAGNLEETPGILPTGSSRYNWFRF